MAKANKKNQGGRTPRLCIAESLEVRRMLSAAVGSTLGTPRIRTAVSPVAARGWTTRVFTSKQTTSTPVVSAISGPATVVGRSIFYNNSVFDAHDVNAGAADDQAIASDKRALLPGQNAAFANYSSYSRGINGVMIDIAGLPSGVITTADFQFRVGTDGATVSNWASALAPASVTVRRGAGVSGSDRVEVIWADGAIFNTWLQVRINAGAATGLAAPDTFYFGNAIGDTGDRAGDAAVDSGDYYATRDHLRSGSPAAPSDWRWDFDRDGNTDINDLLIVRSRATSVQTGTALPLLRAPAQVTPAGLLTDIRDVGSPGRAGSTTFSNGAYTVQGGGADIWNTADSFHFASRPLAGDGSIVARVDSITNTNPFAKAGVMLRTDASDVGAAFADVVVTPERSVSFQWRAAGGASVQAAYAEGIVSVPIWVKVTRDGQSFHGAFSYDGAHWVQIGESVTVSMPSAASAGLAVSAVNNASLNVATFSHVSTLADDWDDADIGAPSVAGRAGFDGSTWTVAGGGSDIFGTSDQFHFTSQQFVGDVTIVARLTSLTNTGDYAKAGLMIRDGSAADASYAFVFSTPSQSKPGQGTNFEYRNGAGTNTASAGTVSGVTAPGWLKLVRFGDSFTAYRSVDGAQWTQIGTSQSIPMSRTISVGLAVSANNNAALNTASFANVSVVPTTWDANDIGSPSLAGSTTFDGLNWTIQGGGSDVWNAADQFHYASQEAVGDVTLIASLDQAPIASAPYAKAGLMIRAGTASNAAYAYLFRTPQTGAGFQGINFEYRDAAGHASQGAGIVAGMSGKVWLKLVRSGNTFTAFCSGDGEVWTPVGRSATLTIDPTARAGLAVSANNATALTAATFGNVFVGVAPVDPFLKTNGVDFRDGHGLGDDVNLRGTNLGGWLLHESWINTLDSSGLPDDVTAWSTLQNRFGEAGADRLMSAFEDQWITTADLDHIAALGLNVVRVPFSYRLLFDDAYNWRSDAFTKLDWIVNESQKRGIYTILDLHGAPGGASPFFSSGTNGGGQLWSDTLLQDRTNEIWSRLAAHFAGNPGIAAYDLLNEPVPPSYDAVWGLYNRLYSSIRAVDPDHVVMMEGSGGAGVGNSYWNLDSLPEPVRFGWTNVAYQTHAYALDGGSAGQGAAQWQVQQFHDRSTYNVPMLVGEFNLGDQENYGVQLWDDNNLNWTSWTYKMTDSIGTSNWGIYALSGQWPWRPDLQHDSMETILAAFLTSSGTEGRWDLNPPLRNVFATPITVADTYHTGPSNPTYVAPAQGVLANDADLNRGQQGISLRGYLVTPPAHGTVTLYEDGSFYYTPAPGFVGTDLFRYRIWDGHNDSAQFGRVSVVVR